MRLFLLFFKTCTFITFQLSCTSISSQVPNSRWSALRGGSGDDYFSHVASLPQGKSLASGFSGSSDYDVPANYGYYDGWLCLFDTSGQLLWSKNYGSPLEDRLIQAYPTPDGKLLAVGFASAAGVDVPLVKGGTDLWLLKVDTLGKKEWAKTLGGTGNDVGTSVLILPSGEIMVAGTTASTDGDLTGNRGGQDYWICKLTAAGELLWQKTYGGSDADVVSEIVAGPDSSFYVSGYSQSSNQQVTNAWGLNDYWVIKIDKNGNLLWQKSLGGSGQDYARSLTSTPDGGLIVAGQSKSNDGDVVGAKGDNDFWLVRLDANGGIVWRKNFGSMDDDRGQCIRRDSSNNYIVSGFSNSGSGDLYDWQDPYFRAPLGQNFWVFKMDENGNLLWQKIYGGDGDDRSVSIATTVDNGVFVAGYTNSPYTPPHYSGRLIRLEGGACVPAGYPTIAASGNNVCPGTLVKLTVISNNLNNSANWVWRKGSAAGTIIGTGTEITVLASETTTYYVYGEAVCSKPVNYGFTDVIVVSSPDCPKSYVFTANGNSAGNWSDTSNWKDRNYPGLSIRIQDTVVIQGSGSFPVITCNANKNIQVYGVVYLKNGNTLNADSAFTLATNWPLSYNKAFMWVDTTSELNVNNAFTVENGGIDNKGNIKVASGSVLLLRNYGGQQGSASPVRSEP